MNKSWTIEQRAKQAAAIHVWQPWQHSTGARTMEGKARASRNAIKPPSARMNEFVCWIVKQLSKAQAGKPSATIEEAKRRAIARGVKL